MTELKSGLGGFFVQFDEDDIFELMTCTGVGDVTLPAGDETPVYCPSLAEVGKFIITDAIEGEVGFNTYSLIRPLRQTMNYILEEMRDCRFNGRINWRLKGSTPDDYTNYLVGLHLHFSRVTSSTLSQPVIITPGENARVDTNADINAWAFEMVYPLTATRITLTEASAINGIVFDLSSECYENEVGGDLIGKEGYFACDAPAGSPALFGDVYFTIDYGSTWTITPAPAFAAGEDAGPIVTRGGRVIVARFETDGANFAEIAYSDDFGTTWTNVDVGALIGQWITSMWWLDSTHLWACATGGYVYFSADRGETWTAQTSGGLTAQNLEGICAYDRENVWAVGAAAAIIRTTDGANWQIVVGPAAIADQMNTVFMRNNERVLIGSDAGNNYITADAGTVWAVKPTPAWAAGEVQKIHGVITDSYRYFDFIAGDTTAPVGQVFRSENGAASFEQVTGITINAGINDLFVIDPNLAWVAGEPQGGTAFLARIHRVS